MVPSNPHSLSPSFQKGSELPVRLALLLQLSSRLSPFQPVPKLCRSAVEAAITQLGFDRMGVWLISATDPDFIEGTWGVDEMGAIVDESNLRVRWRGEGYRSAPGSIQTVYEQAQAERTVTQIVERNVRLSEHVPGSVATGDRLITTLWDGKSVVGFVGIDMCLSKRFISPEDQQVAALLGSILGASVVRSKAEQEHDREAQSRIALMEGLLETCGELAGVNSLDALFRKTVELVPKKLGFSRIGIWLYEPESETMCGTYGIDEHGNIRDERQRRLPREATEHFKSIAARCTPSSERCILENQPLLDDAFNPVGLGTRAVAVLWDGETPQGHISVDDLLGGRSLGEFEGRVLGLFSVTFSEFIGKIRNRGTLESTNKALDQRIHERTQELSRAVEQLRTEIEQRRNAEIELGQQRNLLRSLIDSLPDRVYIKDLEGRYIVSNRYHWASIGASTESEVLGKTCFDFFPEDLAKRYHGKDQEIMSGQQPSEGFIERSVIHTAAGLQDRWFMTWKIPLTGHDGKVAGIVGISSDYTKQKEAEELRAAHFRSMETINLFSEAISKNETTEELVEAVMNLAYERLECRGLWVFHPMPADGEFPGLAFWRNCQDSQLALALSRPSRLKEMLAAEFAVPFTEAGHNCLGTVVRPKVGDPWGVIAARSLDAASWNLEDERIFNESMARFGDALNRIMLRESLLESEARHRALFENSIDGIYRCTADGTFIDVNPSFARMLGYETEEEVLNFNPKEIVFQPPEFDFAREHVAESCELRRRNGEHLFLEVSTHAVRYQSGEIAHFEGIVRDISDRQKMHEAMLHTQKLESLGVLAGGIAHDFNNLLAVILGNADLARTELDPHSPVRESIEQIELASRRGSELCKQMLAYSGKGHFVIQPLSVNDVVNEMTHLLEISINKGVIMRYRMFNQLPAILADATQIRQVIMNLVINASDAIGDRSGVITISTGVFSADSAYLTEAFLAKELPEGDYVYMEVSDTGIGMDPETQARIFDPFFSTKFTGRGLGLAAVLGIVRGHKGAMKVYSEKGVGSTFKVLLPASESLAIKEPGVDDSWKAKKYEGLALVVDDELPVRTMAKRMVEKLGFTAITADNGADGIEAFEEHIGQIKFVLLDMTMPVLAGDGAFREILKMDPDAKVILTSGYNEEEATARFAGKGLAGFLQKPFRLAELRTAVEKALGV